MLGFADAWMGAAQFRANEEQRANERAMAARRLAMAEKEFETSQREAGLRLGALERLDRRRQDLVDAELNGPFDAGIPNPGQGPGVPPQMTPDMATMLENNAPNEGMVAIPPAPQPGQPRAAGPRTNPRSRQAMRALMAEKMDLEGIRRMDAEERAEALQEARRGEFKRLQSLPPDQIVQQFNQLAQGAGLKAMIAWNPKSRNFEMRSEVPGLDSGSVGYGEMLQSIMGLWEAGNGDMEAGFRLISGGIRAQREAGEGAFDRSAKFAAAQSGAFYDNLRADNDATRTRIAREQADRQRRSEAEPIAFTEDNKGMIVWDPATKTTTTIPMPEGAAGAALIRKFQTRTQGPTPKDLQDTIGMILERDPDLSIIGAETLARQMLSRLYGVGASGSGDPAVAAALADAQRRFGGQGSAPAPGGALPAPGTATNSMAVQKTQTPDGREVFRYPGQTQWYPTRAAALAALGQRPQAEAPPMGFTPQ